mgnify:CR=1 FL=1
MSISIHTLIKEIYKIISLLQDTILVIKYLYMITMILKKKLTLKI